MATESPYDSTCQACSKSVSAQERFCDVCTRRVAARVLFADWQSLLKAYPELEEASVAWDRDCPTYTVRAIHLWTPRTTSIITKDTRMAVFIDSPETVLKVIDLCRDPQTDELFWVVNEKHTRDRRLAFFDESSI